jgi:hypothetical protein
VTLRPTHWVAGLATLASITSASCSRPARTDYPTVVRIVATDSGFVVPARIGSGVREVRLLNRGTVMHEGVFERFLTADGRAAAFVESVRAGIDVPSIAEDAGGPGLAAPGDSTVVWMDLLPGHYAVGCWYGNHLTHVGMQDFDVVAAASSAKPPAVDLHVRCLDFAYDFRGSWSAGTHHVLVENAGTEEHEFDPYRLEPGKVPADFFRWIETGRHGPAPAIALGGSGTFPPGGRIWLPLTLTPGRYFAFCQMPAKVGGKSHYQMGMVREFEVK